MSQSQSSLSSIFINKLIDEFNRNETSINCKIIKPLLSKIYQNIYHYLYFIFTLLLLIVIMMIINYITLIYYMRKLIKANIKL